jgi:hypothetical protein
MNGSHLIEVKSLGIVNGGQFGALDRLGIVGADGSVLMAEFTRRKIPLVARKSR